MADLSFVRVSTYSLSKLSCSCPRAAATNSRCNCEHIACNFGKHPPIPFECILRTGNNMPAKGCHLPTRLPLIIFLILLIYCANCCTGASSGRDSSKCHTFYFSYKFYHRVFNWSVLTILYDLMKSVFPPCSSTASSSSRWSRTTYKITTPLLSSSGLLLIKGVFFFSSHPAAHQAWIRLCATWVIL